MILLIQKCSFRLINIFFTCEFNLNLNYKLKFKTTNVFKTFLPTATLAEKKIAKNYNLCKLQQVIKKRTKLLKLCH